MLLYTFQINLTLACYLVLKTNFQILRTFSGPVEIYHRINSLFYNLQTENAHTTRNKHKISEYLSNIIRQYIQE